MRSNHIIVLPPPVEAFKGQQLAPSQNQHQDVSAQRTLVNDVRTVHMASHRTSLAEPLTMNKPGS